MGRYRSVPRRVVIELDRVCGGTAIMDLFHSRIESQYYTYGASALSQTRVTQQGHPLFAQARFRAFELVR